MSDERSDAAQMLLLTAIILAMGFIALTSLVARIEQIPEQAELAQEGAIFDEVDLVSDAIQFAMDGLVATSTNATYEPNLAGALSHMARIEAGRGYYVSTPVIACDDSSGTQSDVTVSISVASLTDEVQFSVTRTYGPGLCL